MKKLIITFLLCGWALNLYALPPFFSYGGGGTVSGEVNVSNDAYNATTWDNDEINAPSRNAVRDKFESLAGDYQPLDTDLTDLATGSPTGTYDLSEATIDFGLEDADIPASIARDSELPTATTLHLDDVLTALGIASEAVNFGTFTGSTIGDNLTAKAIFQALESAFEELAVKYWVDVRDYGDSISTALGVIGEARATLWVPSGISLSEDTTIPANVGLKIQYPGSITLGDYDLTINGPFEAGLHRVFVCDGSGRVAFSSNSTVSAYPQWWGAVADGVTDDGAAVKLWWESGCPRLIAQGSYAIGLEEEILATVTSEPLFADLSLATFTPLNISSGIFRVVCGGYTDISIAGGIFNASEKVARVIQITGSEKARRIHVSGQYINNVKETTQGISAIPINITAEAEGIEINNVVIDGVHRTTVDPGVVACQGISVTSIAGGVSIHDNEISSVIAPEGAVDADGIAVFSRDRLVSPTVRQPVRVDVFNNIIRECSGRFVKAQTTGIRVHSNRFESLTTSLITYFRAVDLQFGGGEIYSNVWDLGSVDGASQGVFAMIQHQATGNYESYTSVHDNNILLSRDLYYIASCKVEAGSPIFSIYNNQVKVVSGTHSLTSLVRLDMPVGDLGSIGLATLKVHNNYAPVSSGYYLYLGPVGSDWGNTAAYAEKCWLEFTDNHLYGVLSPDFIINPYASPSPHLKYFKFRDNVGGGYRINAQSMDYNALPEGTSFYYNTDGSSGGMANTPAGYNRYVYVQKLGAMGIIRKSGAFASKVASGGWYTYAGTGM